MTLAHAMLRPESAPIETIIEAQDDAVETHQRRVVAIGSP